MKILISNRILSLSFKIAIICVIATFLNSMYDGPGHSILWYFQSKILLPALYIGIIISGNAHAPNAIVSYIALFIIYLVIAAFSVVLSKFLYRQILRALSYKKNGLSRN